MAAAPEAEPPAVNWCPNCRMDPITGLVAFPDFHDQFPDHLWKTVHSGALVGLAIGDVDNLKEYVEASNAAEMADFGHMAGYRLMSRLGQVARSWFWEQRIDRGCAATFGGDEIILAVETRDPAGFVDSVSVLQDRLDRQLPRTVSFALTIVGPEASALPTSRSARDLYHHMMCTVDRKLFRHKAMRRASSAPPKSFVVVTSLDASDDVVELTR
jgi:GGDEF domain-containing protein